LIAHRQVGLDAKPLFFAENHSLTSKVEEKGAHRFLGHRVDFNGKLDPSGRPRLGGRRIFFFSVFYQGERPHQKSPGSSLPPPRE
jgi:hypothetical protein